MSVQNQDEILEAFVHPYAGVVGQDFVLMDENARPHRACVASEYIECKSNVWTGLPPPLMLIQ